MGGAAEWACRCFGGCSCHALSIVKCDTSFRQVRPVFSVGSERPQVQPMKLREQRQHLSRTGTVPPWGTWCKPGIRKPNGLPEQGSDIQRNDSDVLAILTISKSRSAFVGAEQSGRADAKRAPRLTQLHCRDEPLCLRWVLSPPSIGTALRSVGTPGRIRGNAGCHACRTRTRMPHTPLHTAGTTGLPTAIPATRGSHIPHPPSLRFYRNQPIDAACNRRQTASTAGISSVAPFSAAAPPMRVRGFATRAAAIGRISFLTYRPVGLTLRQAVRHRVAAPG